MLVALGVALILAGAVMVWFHIPYSPLKHAFDKDVNALISENKIPDEGELFTKDDFRDMPAAVQKFIARCGYIGTPKMSYLNMEFNDIAFKQGRNGPSMTIDYTQYNFVASPSRMALIDSSMFGTPFEGYDLYSGGVGGMKGVVGKAVTLFDVTGEDMDKACLVTFLAESLFVPSALLQGYITFEEISDFKVKAEITYGGQTASGIFTFNDDYEMVSFTTNDRSVAGADGTMEYVPWSAICGEYETGESGIKMPRVLKAVWNYPDGDFVYFDGIISKISYGFEK